MRKAAIIGLLAVALGGCVTTTPSTAVHQPMTARPEARVPTPTVATGAIYNAGNTRPLFEDRRARYVGDIITINITEKTAASKISQNKAERTHTVDTELPMITGLPFKSLQGIGLAAGNSNKFDGKGQNTSTNDFTSTLAVTVIEVLPNGNLLVSGEKQIGLKEGEEFIRFSGIVNPSTISAANSVSSTQVADARIEYKANGFIDSAQVMGWLGRFFLSFLPF